MATVQSTHVISALQSQISDLSMKLALKDAEVIQLNEELAAYQGADPGTPHITQVVEVPAEQ